VEDILAAAAYLPPAEAAARLDGADPAGNARRVLARLLLRLCLGRELGLPPAAVPLSDGGAPALPAETGLFVSVSHSGGLAAAALAAERVGVDVERVRAVRPSLWRLFSPAEADFARALGPEKGPVALWTRHEALFKALGGALMRRDTLGAEAALVHTQLLAPAGEDYALSLACAVPGPPPEVILFTARQILEAYETGG